MLKKRLAWFGTSVVSGGATLYLTWLAVADKLPHWSLYVVGGVILVASGSQFPVNDDGSSRSLVSVLVRGRSNTAITTGNGSPVTGTVVNARKGIQHVTYNGAQLTIADVRQISIDANRAEVLPAVRAVASEAAIAEIDRRSYWLSDRVIGIISERSPELFKRWDDPRFLAALTSAQRGFAETGDEDLGETLANLVADLASQDIRTRKEILLRQGIDLAQRMTTEHINALATLMYLTQMKLSTPYDIEGLIEAFDGLLKPFYGRLPTSEIDYQYMSSTGACYTDQLRRELSWTAYGLIHRTYPNIMYTPFTVPEITEHFLSEDNPRRDENQQLLTLINRSPDDVKYTPEGHTLLSVDNARFRVHPDLVNTILTGNNGSAVVGPRKCTPLTESQTELREMVKQRSITVEQFKNEVVEMKPELAEFLEELQRTGGLHYRLHPVGFVIAKHVIASHAPLMAKAVDDALAAGA